MAFGCNVCVPARAARVVTARSHPADRSRDPLATIPLPDGAGVYHPYAGAGVLYLYGPALSGENFVLSKPRPASANTPALIPYRPARPPVPYRRAQQAELALYEDRRKLAEIVVWGQPCEEPAQDNADFIFLLPMSTISSYLPAPTDAQPQSVSEAVSDEAQQDEAEVGSSSGELFVKHQPSPRRTLRLRFHCNCCGADNVNSVNPVAWRHGTVLMSCGGCGVQHKMVDHLQLFHELGGPLFASATPNELARLRASMPPHLLPDLAGLGDSA